MNVTNSSAAWDGAEWNWGHYIVDIAALSIVAVYSIVYFGSDIGRYIYMKALRNKSEKEKLEKRRKMGQTCADFSWWTFRSILVIFLLACYAWAVHGDVLILQIVHDAGWAMEKSGRGAVPIRDPLKDLLKATAQREQSYDSFISEFRYIDKNTAGLVGNGGGAASAGLPNPTDVGSGRVPRGPLAVPDALRAAAKAAGLTLEMPVRMGGEGGGPSAAALDALSEHLTASSVDADFKAERAAAAAAAAEDAQADGTAAIEVSGEIPEEVVGVGDTAFFPPAGAKATIEDNFFSGEQEEDDVDHDDGGGNDGGQNNDNQRKSETKEREEIRTSLTPTTTGAAPGTTLEPGQTVSVTGLARKPALNGQLGTVLEKDAWPKDNERIGIELRDGKVLSIRPINLRRVFPSKSGPEGAGGMQLLTEVMAGPSDGKAKSAQKKKKKKGVPSRNMTGLVGPGNGAVGRAPISAVATTDEFITPLPRSRPPPSPHSDATESNGAAVGSSVSVAEGVLSVDHPDSPLSSNAAYPLNPGEAEVIPEEGPIYTLNRRMDFATATRPPAADATAAVAAAVAPRSPASAESEASAVQGEAGTTAGSSSSSEGGEGGEEAGHYKSAAAAAVSSDIVGETLKGPNGEEVMPIDLLPDLDDDGNDALVGVPEDVTVTPIEPFVLDDDFDYDTVPYVENPYHVYGSQGKFPPKAATQ